jgi:hypothetical protein
MHYIIYCHFFVEDEGMLVESNEVISDTILIDSKDGCDVHFTYIDNISFVESLAYQRTSY